MPHLIVECSQRVLEQVAASELAEGLHAAMLQCDIFPKAGIRVRVYEPIATAIADLHPDNGFVALTLNVGHGRTKEVLADAGERIFEAARAILAEPLGSAYFALSMEITEIDPVLTWKANSIRPRLQAEKQRSST